MRLLLSILYIFLFLITCQHKATPIISDRVGSHPILTKPTYPPVANVAVDTIKGKQFFQSACGRCHALPSVSQYKEKVWDGYLYTMLPRTKLNNEEAYHVRAYVLAAASK